ncbi:MAG: glycosyltransferase family 39 protein [Planctomycetes bacterium]|nr:glycosyltransferase family 39 protein [Planctomycetota bacterium]
MPRIPRDLLAAALLYATLRLLVLHTAFDQTAMPMYELFPMGTMAELAREQVDLPLSYVYDNAAGQILFGFLTRPFFALFGPTYLALKLVPFTLGLGTLVLLWLFLRSNFSARAASLGAFLYALAPTTLFKYSLMNSGNHFENLFFVLAACVATYRFLRTGGRGALFASGFTSGFALFVFLGALIPVGLLAGLAVGVRGLRQSLRDLPLALLGFALGLAPLIAVNAATGARGLGFLRAKFSDTDERAAGSVLERAGEFLTRHLYDSPAYEPLAGIPGPVLGALFLAAFLVAWLACAPGAARGLGALFTGLAKDAGDATARFQAARCVPAPPLSAARGARVRRLELPHRRPRTTDRRRGLPLLPPTPPVRGAARRDRVRGVDRARRHTARGRLGARDRAAPLRRLQRIDHRLELLEARPRRALRGLQPRAGRPRADRGPQRAHGGADPGARAELPPAARAPRRHVDRLQSRHARDRGPARARGGRAVEARPPALLAGWPSEYQVDLARGQGIALRFTCGGSPKGLAEMQRVLALVLSDAPELGACVAEGACLPPGTEPLESKTAQLLGTNAALRDAVDDTLRPHVLRGTGLFVGRLVVRGIASERARLEEWIAAGAGELEFFVGLGQGLADGGDAPLAPADLGVALAPDDWLGLCLGFGYGLARALGPEAARATFARFVPPSSGTDLRPVMEMGIDWPGYPGR